MHLPNMVKYEELARQNQWWKHGTAWTIYDADMQRFDKQKIKFKRKDTPFEIGKIFVLRGPRRVGKTVFLKRSIEKLTGKKDPYQILYCNCENLLSRKRRELHNVIREFLYRSSKYGERYLFLDEITHIEDWRVELKSLQDTGDLHNVIVVVTGSLPSKLKEESEKMPGRNTENYLLKPMMFRDFVFQAYMALPEYKTSDEARDSIHKLVETLKKVSFSLEDTKRMIEAFSKLDPYTEEIRKLFELYLITGGFPEVINSYIRSDSKDIDNRLYEDIVLWIEGDMLKEGKKESYVAEILRKVLERIGTRYSYTALTKGLESEMSRQTLIDYIETLEKSFVLQVLYPYDFNHKRPRTKATKKIYFSDPFIYHAINSKFTENKGFGYAVKNIANEEITSTLVEGVVATHLARTKEYPIMNEAKDTFLWFYYDANKEIDIIYKETDFLGIEVKYKHNVSSKEMKRIQEMKKYLLLTKDESILRDEKCILVPAGVFLSLLKSSERNL